MWSFSFTINVKYLLNRQCTKFGCLKSMIMKILKSVIIIIDFAFLADIGYLVKRLGNHSATLSLKNFENIVTFRADAWP